MSLNLLSLKKTSVGVTGRILVARSNGQGFEQRTMMTMG